MYLFRMNQKSLTILNAGTGTKAVRRSVKNTPLVRSSMQQCLFWRKWDIPMLQKSTRSLWMIQDLVTPWSISWTTLQHLQSENWHHWRVLVSCCTTKSQNLTWPPLRRSAKVVTQTFWLVTTILVKKKNLVDLLGTSISLKRGMQSSHWKLWWFIQLTESWKFHQLKKNFSMWNKRPSTAPNLCLELVLIRKFF